MMNQEMHMKTLYNRKLDEKKDIYYISYSLFMYKDHLEFK